MPCDRVGERVGEEPEPSEVAGGVHALRVDGGLTGCPQSGTVTAVLRFVGSARPPGRRPRSRTASTP